MSLFFFFVPRPYHILSTVIFTTEYKVFIMDNVYRIVRDDEMEAVRIVTTSFCVQNSLKTTLACQLATSSLSRTTGPVGGCVLTYSHWPRCGSVTVALAQTGQRGLCEYVTLHSISNVV